MDDISDLAYSESDRTGTYGLRIARGMSMAEAAAQRLAIEAGQLSYAETALVHARPAGIPDDLVVNC